MTETKSTAQEELFFAIPAELAQAVLNYLVAQPYGNVAGLIDGFKALQPVTVESAEKKDE